LSQAGSSVTNEHPKESDDDAYDENHDCDPEAKVELDERMSDLDRDRYQPPHHRFVFVSDSMV
jgi:hypothetical protein